MSAERKHKTHTPGPLGTLDRLTPGQQDELFEMLSTSTTMEVLAKISAPPPAGWGLATHFTTLRRFYQRREYQLLCEEVQSSPSSPSDSPETSFATPEVLSRLAQKVVYKALSPNSEGKILNHALKWLAALEKESKRRESMKLEKDKLRLETVKQQTRAINASIRLSHQMNSFQIRQLISAATSMVKQSLGPSLEEDNTDPQTANTNNPQ
jgi:hypothetical protein